MNTITISGLAKSGKSTLAYHIAKYLRKQMPAAQIRVRDTCNESWEIMGWPKLADQNHDTTQVLIRTSQTRRQK